MRVVRKTKEKRERERERKRNIKMKFILSAKMKKLNLQATTA